MTTTTKQKFIGIDISKANFDFFMDSYMNEKIIEKAERILLECKTTA